MRSWLLLALPLLATACSGQSPSSASGKGFPAKLTAIGTEPFWSIAIDGGDIVYSSPDDEAPEKARFVRSEIDGKLTLAGRLKDAQAAITIAPAKCSDGMSDRIYPYSAEVRWGERTLQGCALRPGS